MGEVVNNMAVSSAIAITTKDSVHLICTKTKKFIVVHVSTSPHAASLPLANLFSSYCSLRIPRYISIFTWHGDLLVSTVASHLHGLCAWSLIALPVLGEFPPAKTQKMVVKKGNKYNDHHGPQLVH